jgi:hypothetical protein
MMAWAQYAEKVRGLLAGLEVPGHVPAVLSGYFAGHEPRFATLFEMLHAILPAPKSILDVGTGFPFATGWVADEGGRVIYGCPLRLEPVVWPGCVYQELNLCAPPQPPAFLFTTEVTKSQFDLVVCTECLEHLPCNLFPVRDWLGQAVCLGGYLLLSFPLGGQHAEGYHHDYPPFEVLHDEHLREWTMGTAEVFVYGMSGFTVALARLSNQPAYGSPIWNVLLEKVPR